MRYLILFKTMEKQGNELKYNKEVEYPEEEDKNKEKKIPF